MISSMRKSASAAIWLAAVAVTLLLAPTSSLAQSNTAYGIDTLYHNTSGYENSAFGAAALFCNTTGNANTAVGGYSLYSNTTGVGDTALGDLALYFNTTGTYNTATGFYSLYENSTGYYNTANGAAALYTNSTGAYNTAAGYAALYYNTTGNNNTADGANALTINRTGYNDTATGAFSLHGNTSGFFNTATGVNALYANTTGYYNTSSGAFSLESNTTGYYNTANGVNALNYNTTGFDNTAVGDGALYNNSTGSSNVAIGESAGANLTTGSHNIDIGNYGVAGEAGVIRVGIQGTSRAAFIAGINGATGGAGLAVFVNTNGQLYTKRSSRRLKTDIHTMSGITDRLMKLRPVTFRYKQAAPDGTHPVTYGLIAEEVAKVFPDLVQYDKARKPLAVYYDALTPMLLNAVQVGSRAMGTLRNAWDAQLRSLYAAHNMDVCKITNLSANPHYSSDLHCHVLLPAIRSLCCVRVGARLL
ncbi:MAG TPA: tail fiber domain-containing protein [Chthonomonadales bacterium]|nr:tail fiber domain-containing protein [Chthonomonadales bacterium]